MRLRSATCRLGACLIVHGIFFLQAELREAQTQIQLLSEVGKFSPDSSQVISYLKTGGWGAQGFLTPEVDFPSLEFLKCT